MEPVAYEVEDALINGDFFLEYQPIVRLQSRECAGAESLIRWRRDCGVVEAGEFIPQIESSPLAGFLTYWVIETVARELGNWLRRTPRVFASVNVPPKVLGRGGVLYVAARCGLTDILDKLVLEVTERGIPESSGCRPSEKA